MTQITLTLDADHAATLLPMLAAMEECFSDANRHAAAASVSLLREDLREALCTADMSEAEFHRLVTRVQNANLSRPS